VSIITVAADIAAYLAESDTRDAMHRAALGREREAYLRGHEDGERAGYERGRSAEAAEREAAWEAWVADTGITRGGIPHEELERRRWSDGGRKSHLRLLDGGAS
jgi:hypothetical protein